MATHAVRLTQLPVPAEPADDAEPRRLAALERVDVLAPLGRDRLERLAGQVVEQVYAGGDQIVRQGEPGGSLYVIDMGSAEVRLRADQGSETLLATLGPGEVFGEMSLLTGAARSATVTMREEGRLLRISKEMLQGFLEEEPALAARFGEVLARRAAERSAAATNAGPAPAIPKDLLAKILEFFSL